MVYDELNRKTGETVNYGGFSKSFSYDYDQRGNKTGYTSPEGIAHSYEYLLNDRLKKIDFDGKVLDLNYDKTRLQQILYPNGVTTDYSYNVGGWLSGIQTKKGLATLLQRDYQFDHVGNIGTMTTQAGDTIYGYDDIYQLTVADHPQATGLADESFSYDRVGNRLTSAVTNGSWSHNQNNELTDTTVASYEYDANGNTVKMTVGTQVTRYEYNARNRLAQVILPSGQVASYSYDPFGRRVRKQVDSAATWYVYAEEGLVGEYSASGSMQKVYGWMPDGTWGTDPLYMRDGSGLYYYHNDHLGTPQRLTSAASGAVVWSAGYAAFGKAEIDPLSTVENNLRFPGQYFDAETSLHYNWYRTYDPGVGLYTQVDPIGFAGGSLNLYRYVQNNPINLIDPLGLQWTWGSSGTALIVDYGWDSSNPAKGNAAINIGSLMGGGFNATWTKDEKPTAPINGQAISEPFIYNVGLNKWLGVSFADDFSSFSFNIGFGIGLPISISKPLEGDFSIGGQIYDAIHNPNYGFNKNNNRNYSAPHPHPYEDGGRYVN